jgi:hypothetical protein
MTIGGSSLLWWTSALAGVTQRKTPSGDLLEAEHGELLQYIPCFCGCGRIGHQHNADCYVSERLPGGAITFTSHGAL